MRRIHPAPTYEANFAAPEDVIIKKMEYYSEGGSEKHLRDITGMLVTSEGEIDRLTANPRSPVGLRGCRRTKYR
jgi:hypothetical protein